MFNLKKDPNEKQDVSQEEPQQVSLLRSLLIEELEGRPEGFVKDHQLVPGRLQKPIIQAEIG